MNNDLEQSVLHGLICGSITLDSLKPHVSFFSDEGKQVYEGVKWLTGQGKKPPFTHETVALTVSEIIGKDYDLVLSYVKEMQAHNTGPDVQVVLEGASNKLKLLTLQQAVLSQMAERTYDEAVFTKILTNHQETGSLESLTQEVKKWGEDDGTTRIAIGDAFPTIQHETGGISGFWVIGGPTGVGKSTLAWQLGLIAARDRPVLYYDMENTKRVLYERTVRIHHGEIERAHEALARVFVRGSPATLWRDLSQVGKGGVSQERGVLVVIDSLQKLPSKINLKRETIEEWLVRLDSLKQEGHTVIVVSQLNRGQGDYKGTIDIEHTADFGVKVYNPKIQGTRDDDPARLDVYVEKNRHGLKRGYQWTLQRVNEWEWME